jgi:hypothetical protein
VPDTSGPPRADDDDAARITASNPGLVPDADADRAALTRAAYAFFQTFFSGHVTDPDPAVLRALRTTISDTKKVFAARASLLRAEARDHEQAASTGTEGAVADIAEAADALAREHLAHRLKTTLDTEALHLQTPNELGTVDDCLAALHLLCKALAKRSTEYHRPLNEDEWTVLDHVLTYTLLLIAAHDSPQQAGTPPETDNPPPRETPRPNLTTDRATRGRPSDELQ